MGANTCHCSTICQKGGIKQWVFGVNHELLQLNGTWLLLCHLNIVSRLQLGNLEAVNHPIRSTNHYKMEYELWQFNHILTLILWQRNLTSSKGLVDMCIYEWWNLLRGFWRRILLCRFQERQICNRVITYMSRSCICINGLQLILKSL